MAIECDVLVVGAGPAGVSSSATSATRIAVREIEQKETRNGQRRDVFSDYREWVRAGDN